MEKINKNRKIVIITAPLPYKDDRSASLGLRLLYATLKKAGFKNVTIIDAAFEGMQVPKLMQIIKSKAIGMSFLGLSVLPSSLQASREFLNGIRKEFGHKVEICLGGYFPTSFGKETFDFFKDSNLDYIVMGRGEFAIVDILKYGKSRSIPNVIIKDGNTIIDGGRSPVDFSVSPWPDRSDEKITSKKIARIYRLVGCPGNCNFCNIHIYAQDIKNDLIQRTATDFVAEIEYLFHEKKKNCFDILDEDALGKNPEEWWDILNEIDKRGLKGKIKFWILCRIPSVANNEKLIRAMSLYGLVSCYCGLESWSFRQLKSYNKAKEKDISIFLKQAEVSKKILESCGVIPKYGFIPLDAESTLEEYINNIEILVKKGFLYYVSELTKRLAIYKGSVMESIYKRKNLLIENDFKKDDKDWITNRYNYIFVDPQIQMLSRIFDVWLKGIIQSSIRIKKAMIERLEDVCSQKSIRTWKIFKILRDKELEMVKDVINLIQNNVDLKKINLKVKDYINEYNQIEKENKI